MPGSLCGRQHLRSLRTLPQGEPIQRYAGGSFPAANGRLHASPCLYLCSTRPRLPLLQILYLRFVQNVPKTGLPLPGCTLRTPSQHCQFRHCANARRWKYAGSDKHVLAVVARSASCISHEISFTPLRGLTWQSHTCEHIAHSPPLRR